MNDHEDDDNEADDREDDENEADAALPQRQHRSWLF